jgi:hypothetical protein
MGVRSVGGGPGPDFGSWKQIDQTAGFNCSVNSKVVVQSSISQQLNAALKMPTVEQAWQYYGDHYKEESAVTEALSASGFENPLDVKESDLNKHFGDLIGRTNKEPLLLGAVVDMANSFWSTVGFGAPLKAAFEFELFRHNCLFVSTARFLGFKAGMYFPETLSPYQMKQRHIHEQDMTPFSWVLIRDDVLRVDLRCNPLATYIKMVLSEFLHLRFPLEVMDTSYMTNNSARQILSRYAYLKGRMYEEMQNESLAEEEFTKAAEIDPTNRNNMNKVDCIAGDLFHIKCLDRFSTFSSYLNGSLPEEERSAFNGLYRKHRSIRFLLNIEVEKMKRGKGS